MDFSYPDRETIAAMFEGEELSEFTSEVDSIDMLDMGVQALKIAIEESSLEEYKPLEYYFEHGKNIPYYKLDPDVLKELNIPRVTVKSDEDGVPLLVLRLITKEGEWIGESVCCPLRVSGYFVGRAFAIVNDLKSGGLTMTDDDFRVFIIRKTANMLKSAFAKINERIEIMVNSFLSEVFLDWAELWYEYHAEYNSLLGYKMGRLHVRKQLSKEIEVHRNDIEAFWKDDSQKELVDLKKMRLALEYQKTYEHWKEMERLQAEGKNWRRYVKADDMADVSDDLIDVFINKDDISGLALEHAARRVGLFNIYDVSDTNLEKRKQGIMVSGYSRPTLFNYKREGEELLHQRYDNSQSNDLTNS